MSTEFKIEKGIPLTRCATQETAFTETLRKLEVGDSFVITKKDAGVALHTRAKQAGVKIASRTISPTEFRIWRIA